MVVVDIELNLYEGTGQPTESRQMLWDSILEGQCKEE